ncbi:MAG TPA: hypothetical protein EYN67_03880 [Flavobacteriales bacterium]|nr:hypothetical protein [Flavobacteriales bacterium]
MSERKSIERLERQIQAIESELATIIQMAVLSQQNTDGNQELDGTDALHTNDVIWNCEKCSFRLGIYDTEGDELRIRYKDFYAYWTAGVGGKLKIICRSCSHVNVVRYTKENPL